MIDIYFRVTVHHPYIYFYFYFVVGKQITSSEYFSISFDCFEDPGQEEFVAASKGTSLRYTLILSRIFPENDWI